MTQATQKVKKQRGWVSVEAGLVALLVAGAVGFAFYTFGNVTKSMNSTNIVRAVSTMISNARNLYSSTGDYDETGTAPNNGLANINTWINGKLYQKPFKSDSVNIIDPWGNNISVGASNTVFGLAFGGTGISSEECVKVAQGLLDLGNQLNVGGAATISAAGVVSGGQTVKADASSTPLQSKITTGCNETNPKIAVNFR